MTDLEQFRNDPLQPEYAHLIRPLRFDEREHLENRRDVRQRQAAQLKPRSWDRRIMNCVYASIVGSIIGAILSPLWFLPVSYLWEHWRPGRVPTQVEERSLFFLPLIAGAVTGITISLTRERREKSRYLRGASRYQAAIDRGVVHVVTIRAVRCLSDFEERHEMLRGGDRIVYEMPSGAHIAAGPPDYLEFDAYTRTVVQFRTIPDCEADFDVVSGADPIPIVFYTPGGLLKTQNNGLRSPSG